MKPDNRPLPLSGFFIAAILQNFVKPCFCVTDSLAFYEPTRIFDTKQVVYHEFKAIETYRK